MLAASLIWSTACSSAVQEPMAGGGCKSIEAPKLLRSVEPDYPEEIRKQGVKGKVVAEAVLTPDGALEDIRIVSSPSEALSQLALKAFSQWRYKAAFCRNWGKPIRVYITMTAAFNLHGGRRR
jgi:protein TonB